MNSNVWKTIGAAVLLTVMVGTTSGVRAQAPASLYDRLGGQPAIQAVASGLVDRILLDTRVNRWFAHAAASPENAAAYKAKLADFVCQATGGPCQYTGRDMVTAHTGRAVTGEAFDAVVQDLLAVLEGLKVPEKEKGQLLALLGPLKASIVQK
ncbi:MAG: group 1 truncated hemoglobin [Acidobacteriota bacterium]